MNRTIVLKLDEDDYATIQEAIAEAWQDLLPDGTSNLAGAVLAECVRDRQDYRDLWERDHPDGRENAGR